MSRRSPRIVVVGDALLDRDVVGQVDRLCPDAPVPVVDVASELSGPGGAGLTALLCRDSGAEVQLVAAAAQDPAGDELRTQLAAAGVELVGLGHEGPTRTKTRVRSNGQTLLRLDEGGPGAPTGELPDAARSAIESADVVLVSCYGAGVSADEGLRTLLRERAPRRPVVWDPHPRGSRPVELCTVVTPNLDEARTLGRMPSAPPDEVGRALVDLWSAGSVCVTAGATGAWLVPEHGDPLHVPTDAADGDTCGAGDRFAATVATELASGATRAEAVLSGVGAASRWVRSGATAGFRESAGSADVGSPVPPGPPPGGAGLDVISRVRRRGGTVVATGGCFDILHAGHIACLEAARELGDCLVVLLNSDSSVRGLKGPGRPVQPAADRARVLRGLACVDAVVEFDEETPERLLSRLRPDVWVKGGDYEGAELPESRMVRSWGGRVALLPYLSGRSTTAILAEAT